MKRALKTLALSAVLSGAVASPALADGGFGPFNNVCAGGLYQTCFSVSFSWTGNVATLTITNLAGEGDLIKAVGIANLPSDPAYTVGGQAGYVPPGNDLNNLPPTVVAASANDQGDMIADGGTGVWIFTFTGLSAAETDALLANAVVGAHFISGPGGCSTKWSIDAQGNATGQGGEAGEGECGTTTVPEPATMGLLAIGLVGLVGAGAVRRRREKNAV
jgi:hypothetical protein